MSLVLACGPSGDGSGDGTDETTSAETSTFGTSTTTAPTGDTTGTEDTGTTTGELEPYCCGCLCVDEGWSCSEDTCVTIDGLAVELAPEAGFFEIEGGSYIVDNQNAIAGHARVWYSFHPADTDPEDKPLLVFFNGGPGASTGPLFGFNTSTWSLDPDRTGTESIVATAEPWTRFGNLLHVDAPNTGFSYSLPIDQGIEPPVGIDPDRDAAAFVKLIVRFLDRHPQIQANQVMIVGESYGGVRGTLMMRHILDYEILDDGFYQDPGMQQELRDHFAAIFPETDGTNLPREKVAEQFSHMALIQPVVAGFTQDIVQPPPNPPGCIPNHDPYQCSEIDGWTFDRIYQVAARLVDLEVLEQALGVDPTTIEWMHADARVEAYGRSFVSGAEAAVVDQSEMIEVFGELNPVDNYYVGFNWSVNDPGPWGRMPRDPFVGNIFLFDAYYSDTFITHAAFDLVVWSPAIPVALDTYDAVVQSVVHDTDPRPNVDRPGWMQVSYQPDVVPGELDREIRFPFYPGSGHIVTLSEPEALLSDIEDWYAGG